MVAASTVIGWGEVSPITFFTQQTSKFMYFKIEDVDFLDPEERSSKIIIILYFSFSTSYISKYNQS